jgi:hypothetical protein
VFYLATDHVERGRAFPGGGRPLSWAAAGEAVDSGFVTIGSHTHRHALLDRLDAAAGLIGERLGVDAEHFAYPKALLAAPGIEPLVRERFRSAALGGNRPNHYGTTDPHRLARSPIQRRDGMRFFVRKAQGGMALEERARRRLDRWRYSRSVS